MEENTQNALFNLMQNVIDKLDVIEVKIQDNNPILKNFLERKNNEITILLENQTSNQTKLLNACKNSEKRLESTIKLNKPTPSQNNYIEYSLIGNNSRIKPWILLSVLFSLTTIWCSIKYLPSYFLDRSEIMQKQNEYKTFYNYTFLKEFEGNKQTRADNILSKIKKSDSALTREYNKLFNTYSIEIQKKELKKKLKALEKNDHQN